jgi:tRNA-2-methylthio-N6-dimethylallyladenosine synthase
MKANESLKSLPASPAPLGVYISTYGCQMNVNDSERMLSLLEMMNYSPVPTPDQASLIIINSCSVREKPVHKVHSEVGRYRILKEKNPLLKIGVGGCVAQQEKNQLLTDIPLLDFVFGTDAIDQLPSLVEEVRAKSSRVHATRFEHQKPYQIQTLIRNPGVSTFVNIMKGCDNFCTFCVVPFTRGRERSRELPEVIKDVQSLASRGVKEVNLLGQNVNSYRSSGGEDFADLLGALAVHTDIERIRYITSHPKDFNEKLVSTMRDHQDKICEYIHLPVQAGNSEILHRMNRGYTREEYISKVKMIFSGLPNAVLSTDIIVGFPGETEDQFKDTLSILDEVPYESLYAFQYSPRPFTKAAKYTDQVPEDVKNERLQRLFARHNEIAYGLAKKYEGQRLKVLVEEYKTDSGRVSGRSTQNKVVHFLGSDSLVGQTVEVRINEAFPQTLRGDWIQ